MFGHFCLAVESRGVLGGLVILSLSLPALGLAFIKDDVDEVDVDDEDDVV